MFVVTACCEAGEEGGPVSRQTLSLCLSLASVAPLTSRSLNTVDVSPGLSYTINVTGNMWSADQGLGANKVVTRLSLTIIVIHFIKMFILIISVPVV